MIEVNHVIKRYGSREVLSDVSFKLRNGHTYGLVGPTGAGKTTVMHIMAGCIPPTEGEVLINGYDSAVYPKEAKRRIGYLPADLPLFPRMTPYEYLTFIAEVKGVRAEQTAHRVAEMLTLTGLAPMADRLCRNLDEVARRRLGLAQTLLGTPDMILLDEPTTGLDPQQSRAFLTLVHRLTEKLTVVISAPTLEVVRPLCEQVIRLEAGRVVAEEAVIAEAAAGEMAADPETAATFEDDLPEVDFHVPEADEIDPAGDESYPETDKEVDAE